MLNLTTISAMVSEKKLFEVVKYVLICELEQNNASKQKIGHCDKTTLHIFCIFTIPNIFVSLIFHAKIQPKILVVLEKKMVLLSLLFK